MEEWERTHTNTFLPLYSSKMDDRPTSLPDPRGVNFNRSFSSTMGISISALRLMPAMEGGCVCVLKGKREIKSVAATFKIAAGLWRPSPF